ncbi:hypothetical protein HWB31_gp38 [Pseudomonas phage SL1]|uniref:Uncharacterized protein n=1 Tax=Pseudomonas phage SL1 TaxID=2041215 RepID=A0A2I7SBQ0_9CAUD|nr:hypothetical protein HWB31_gp38 [Pseudomonas phage SL1]AUS03314.1 hypothetical protein SL1_39 [Pseudomonas phage SL1]
MAVDPREAALKRALLAFFRDTDALGGGGSLTITARIVGPEGDRKFRASYFLNGEKMSLSDIIAKVEAEDGPDC